MARKCYSLIRATITQESMEMSRKTQAKLLELLQKEHSYHFTGGIPGVPTRNFKMHQESV